MLTELWAERLRGSGVAVHAMHPGWSLTPGLQTALPDFVEGRRKDEDPLRTAAEGADTIAWLAATGTRPLSRGGGDTGSSAAAAAALLAGGGGFWFDRSPAPADFAWAGTRSSPAEFAALWAAAEDACGFTLADSLAGEAVAEAATGGPLPDTAV